MNSDDEAEQVGVATALDRTNALQAQLRQAIQKTRTSDGVRGIDATTAKSERDALLTVTERLDMLALKLRQYSQLGPGHRSEKTQVLSELDELRRDLITVSYTHKQAVVLAKSALKEVRRFAEMHSDHGSSSDEDGTDDLSDTIDDGDESRLASSNMSATSAANTGDRDTRSCRSVVTDVAEQQQNVSEQQRELEEALTRAEAALAETKVRKTLRQQQLPKSLDRANSNRTSQSKTAAKRDADSAGPRAGQHPDQTKSREYQRSPLGTSKMSASPQKTYQHRQPLKPLHAQEWETMSHKELQSPKVEDHSRGKEQCEPLAQQDRTTRASELATKPLHIAKTSLSDASVGFTAKPSHATAASLDDTSDSATSSTTNVTSSSPPSATRLQNTQTDGSDINSVDRGEKQAINGHVTGAAGHSVAGSIVSGDLGLLNDSRKSSTAASTGSCMRQESYASQTAAPPYNSANSATGDHELLRSESLRRRYGAPDDEDSQEHHGNDVEKVPGPAPAQNAISEPSTAQSTTPEESATHSTISAQPTAQGNRVMPETIQEPPSAGHSRQSSSISITTDLPANKTAELPVNKPSEVPVCKVADVATTRTSSTSLASREHPQPRKGRLAAVQAALADELPAGRQGSRRGKQYTYRGREAREQRATTGPKPTRRHGRRVLGLLAVTVGAVAGYSKLPPSTKEEWQREIRSRAGRIRKPGDLPVFGRTQSKGSNRPAPPPPPIKATKAGSIFDLYPEGNLGRG